MSSPYSYNCMCIRVVDGDTIDVNIDLGFSIMLHKQRIRLLGINAPETRTRDLVEKEAGLQAKEWLADLIEGEQVIVKTELDGKGKFGRILGTVYIGGENLNQRMIREGLADPYE